MKLTQEQTNILSQEGNIKINAVAGSGKTTTILQFAKSKPPTSEILYLAFNKSVKLDAKRKMDALGLKNVKVETAHSLAFKHIVVRSGYKINPFGYKIHELVDLLSIKSSGEKHEEFVLSNHVQRCFSYFCNSDKTSFDELNYLDIVSDKKAKAIVRQKKVYIQQKAQELFDKMLHSEIEVTHDWYLKQFQLSQPKLTADYILFDEGQDASAAMLDVFLRQKAVKVIVGDTHQQIYGWRFAINAMDKVAFTNHFLTNSFRFNQEVADLANAVLNWKKMIDFDPSFQIKGKGTNKALKTKAIIARTNLGLLLKAIQYVTESKQIGKIYFEGNFNSYSYADDGASLYDVLHLYNNKPYLIRDKLIRKMNSLLELEDYISKTDDIELAMMVEIVKGYGNEIPQLLKLIKSYHLPHDNKEEAEMIFSTVHRCKGMEYDEVKLANDFITEEKVRKFSTDLKRINGDFSKINEEINLLYVAITRTTNRLYLPESIIPLNFKINQDSTTVFITSTSENLEAEKKENLQIDLQKETKAFSFQEIRLKFQQAYFPWTKESDDELLHLKKKGEKVSNIAKHFGRTNGAIRSRIKKLDQNLIL
ncbi:MAG: ATP-dependent helicase [Fluviicola sp.]|nr:ATP-dependent helicase [Fluviicola sp.]